MKTILFAPAALLMALTVSEGAETQTVAGPSAGKAPSIDKPLPAQEKRAKSAGTPRKIIRNRPPKTGGRLYWWQRLKKKQYEAVIAHYTWSIRNDPDHPYAYEERARAYFLKKDYKRAIADCTEVIRRARTDEDLAEAYWDRAKVYKAKGDRKRAAADRRKARKLDPEVGQ